MVTFIGEVTYNNVQRFNKELLLRETTAPSATDGYGSLYVQADGYLYYKDFDGTQTNLTNVGAATPAGSDREIQFNDAGALGASSSLSLSASNELILDGYAYLNGVAVAGNVGISGNLVVSNDVTIGDNLILTGDADISGILSVDGEIQNTQLQNALDGYALSATENSHWIEGVGQRQDIRDALDGYALSATENVHWIEGVEQRQDIRDALDGYSTLTTAQGADGYIAFFTGSDAIAGDNDLFYNRATGDVTIGSGGSLSVAQVKNSADVLNLGASAVSTHSLSANADVIVGGKLEVDGYTYLDASVAVAGDAGISGDLVVSGDIQTDNLAVDGYSYLNGVAVAGNAGISGDLIVSNDVTIGDNLTLIGYASVAGDLNVTGEIHNTQLQNTLDGYALSATENTHWIEGVEQRQSIRDALDGYSTLTTAQGADGYIAFFTGSDSIAGDNDLFYNRATGDVIIGGGGDLSISGDVTVGVADGYSSLIIYGTVYNPLPGQLAPSGSNTEIDLSEGNSRVLNLMNVSGSTLTVTLSNYKEGASYVIKVIQHPSSAKNVTFTGVLWEGSSAPTISAGASAVDIISFWSDGVSLYGSYIQNLS